MGRSQLPYGQKCPQVFSKPNNPGGRIREPLSIGDPVPRKSSLSLCLSGHPGNFYMSSHRNGHTGHDLSLWAFARPHWLSDERGWGRQAPVLPFKWLYLRKGVLVRAHPLDVIPKESQRDTGTTHSSLLHKPLKLLIQTQNDFVCQDALHCRQ